MKGMEKNKAPVSATTNRARLRVLKDDLRNLLTEIEEPKLLSTPFLEPVDCVVRMVIAFNLLVSYGLWFRFRKRIGVGNSSLSRRG